MQAQVDERWFGHGGIVVRGAYLRKVWFLNYYLAN